ncbi:MAG: ATP-binding protein, partial [Agathobacter sp.]|nr:ATP-binding protein [Agathobacter sp.]
MPEGNEKEATLVQNVKVYGFSNLKDVIDFLNGKKITKKPSPTSLKIPEKTMDFSEVNGQNYLKRACEIAAAGMHNLLLIGPPGAGKTMISERLSTILPPLTEEEQLELSKIYSVCGLLKDQESLITERPFRSPHHTITKIGLAGGGTMLRPGEISLAHKGVLFLDELPEFQKASIEILRQPLEEKQVRLVRARGSVTYPADFLLLASMNPCNCGYYPNMQKCRCTPGSIKRYLERISQPFLDRMDICAEAVQISYKELTGTGTNETSAQIRERVVRCHEIQRARFQNESFCYNSRIPAS